MMFLQSYDHEVGVSLLTFEPNAVVEPDHVVLAVEGNFVTLELGGQQY